METPEHPLASCSQTNWLNYAPFFVKNRFSDVRTSQLQPPPRPDGRTGWNRVSDTVYNERLSEISTGIKASKNEAGGWHSVDRREVVIERGLDPMAARPRSKF
jgi:hypothetical protein